MGGPGPSTCQKDGLRDSRKNLIKFMGMGGQADLAVKQRFLRFLKTKQRMVLSRAGNKVLGFYEMLELCWKWDSKLKWNTYLQKFS